MFLLDAAALLLRTTIQCVLELRVQALVAVVVVLVYSRYFVLSPSTAAVVVAAAVFLLRSLARSLQSTGRQNRTDGASERGVQAGIAPAAARLSRLQPTLARRIHILLP